MAKDPSFKKARAVATSEWSRGYYCAVAMLLREAGCVTAAVRSLYEQGGSPASADADDIQLFAEHGLTQ